MCYLVFFLKHKCFFILTLGKTSPTAENIKGSRLLAAETPKNNNMMDQDAGSLCPGNRKSKQGMAACDG